MNSIFNLRTIFRVHVNVNSSIFQTVDSVINQHHRNFYWLWKYDDEGRISFHVTADGKLTKNLIYIKQKSDRFNYRWKCSIRVEIWTVNATNSQPHTHYHTYWRINKNSLMILDNRPSELCRRINTLKNPRLFEFSYMINLLIFNTTVVVRAWLIFAWECDLSCYSIYKLNSL